MPVSVRPLLIGLREVRSFLADPGALAFALALPLVMVALMLAAFGGETTFSGTAYIVDRDNGHQAERLLEELRSIDGLSVSLLSASEAEDRIDRSAILMYTEIPAGFTAAIDAGGDVDLIQYQRGGGGQVGQIVSSMIRGALQRLTVERDLRAQTSRMLTLLEVETGDEEIDQQVQTAAATIRTSPAVAVETVSPDDEDTAPLAASLFPRIAAWMVLFTVAISAQTFILERRTGTLERLLTTRLTFNELFTGKWLAYFLRGYLQFLVLFAIAGLFFDFFTTQSWLLACLFGMVATAAISSIGLVIATLVRSENQAIWGAVFFTMAMAVLGGTFFDSASGDLFGIVSRFTVTWWMNTAFDSLLIDREGIGSIATPVAVLLAITVIGLVVSRYLFKPLPGGSHG
jgi:ABC-2 type transport system permease protein